MRVLIVTAVPPERDAVTSGLLRGTGDPPDGGPGTPAEGHGTAAGSTGLPGKLPLPDGRLLHRTGGFDVLAGGVGPAGAAAATATALTAAALTDRPYDLAVSAGIGGGFPGTGSSGTDGRSTEGGTGCVLGGVVVADALVAADLGAQTSAGFTPVTGLGFGTCLHRPPEQLVHALTGALSATGAAVRTGPVLTVSTVTGTAARAAELAARHPGAAAEAMEGFGVAEAAAAHGVPVLELRAVSNTVGPRDRDAWRIPEALSALGGACAALPGVLQQWTP